MTPPPIPPRSSSRQQMRSASSQARRKPVLEDMDITDIKLWDMRPLAIRKKGSILLPSSYNFRFLPGGSFKVSKWKPIYPPEACDDPDITDISSLKLPPFAPRVGLPDHIVQQTRKTPGNASSRISKNDGGIASPANRRTLLGRSTTQKKHSNACPWNLVQQEDHSIVRPHGTQKHSPSVSKDRSCFGSHLLTSLVHRIKGLFKRTPTLTNEVVKTFNEDDEDLEVIQVWWSDEIPPLETMPPNSNGQEVPASWVDGKGHDYHGQFEQLEAQTFGQSFRESLGLELP